MKQVIIIGAGPAGLTAAYELLRSGGDFAVTVLEQSQSIGGISRTVRHDGNRMDIGGHRFFSKDDRVTEWWRSLMPLQGAPALDDRLLGRDRGWSEGGPDPESDDRVMLKRERVSRIYYKKHFFDYPVSLSWDTIKGMGFLTTMKAGFSYLHACVSKLPETSLENFYINRFGRVLYSMFFEGYTEKLWGRSPAEISADWGAQRVKGLSITAVIRDVLRRIFGSKNAEVETSLIEEFSYPKFGPGQLWELVADEIRRMGGEVRMGCAVDELNCESGRVKSVGFTENGERKTLDGDLVLSTMPVKDLVADVRGLAVPGNVSAAAAGLPYRDFVTVGLLVDRLELVNKTGKPTLGNIVPDCWIYVQDTGVKLGRIQIFNNWSPYLVADPEHTVWIGLEYFCSEGDEFWNLPESECVDFAVNELVKMGIIKSADCVRDSHRERVQKAYPAYFDTYAQMGDIIDWLDGFGNLYCLGRNGQHRYNNMDHSMATAFEAVSNILSGREDKSNVWNVNTEKSYHEKK